MTFSGKSSVIATITLILSCGTILVHIGVTKAHIEEVRTGLSNHKAELKEKIKEIEVENKISSKEVSDKLENLGKDMAVVLSWINEQRGRK